MPQPQPIPHCARASQAAAAGEALLANVQGLFKSSGGGGRSAEISRRKADVLEAIEGLQRGLLRTEEDEKRVDQARCVGLVFVLEATTLEGIDNVHSSVIRDRGGESYRQSAKGGRFYMRLFFRDPIRHAGAWPDQSSECFLSARIARSRFWVLCTARA